MPTLEEHYLISETVNQGRDCLVLKGQRKKDGVPVIIKKARRSADRAVADGLRRAYLFTKNGRIPQSIQSLSLEDDGANTSLIILDEGLQGLDQVELSNLSLETKLQVATHMTQAVASVHQAGLVHRDLKPSNFLVRLEPLQVQLTDFDAAGFVHQEFSQRLTGTPAYMSPEQTGKLQHTLDRRSDLYSLGVTLYQLFSGRLPFNWSSTEELLALHLQSAPEPLPNHLPISLHRVIQKMLQKEPLQRYQSAEGVLSDLKRLCDNPWDIFAVGREDIPTDFSWPGELIGRSLPLKRLLDAYAQAGLGTSQAVMISGLSGTGKSSLLSGMRITAAHQGSIVGQGKFDQIDRTQPFSALLQALSQINTFLLSLEEGRLAELATRVRDSLGPSLGLLQTLLPETQIWLGPCHPSHLQQSAGDARKQVLEMLVKYLRCLAIPDLNRKAPLLLIIDDIQWADAESLFLIEALCQHPDLPNFFLLGAYRSESIPAGHSIQNLRATRLEIQELSATNLLELVCQIALCNSSEGGELADLLHRKTLGNPYHTRQFLQAARRDGQITFNVSQGRWEWNLPEIEARPITPNVLPLVTKRIDHLSPSSLEYLQVAACLGATFSVRILAKVQQVSVFEVWDKVFPAAQQELLCQNSDGEHLSFAHDSVQQAIYQSISSSSGLHAKIGLVLLEQERWMEAVSHLNLGRSHLTPANVQRLFALNLKAAQTACLSSAYEFAQNCLSQITQHWDPENLEQFPRNFQREVHLQKAQVCAYLNEEERLEQSLEIGQRLCQTPLEQVEFLQIRLFFDINRIQWEKVLATGFQTLRLLGEEISTHPEESEVGQELGLTLQALGPSQSADILALPDMECPISLAATKVYKAITTAGYFSRPNVYPIAVFRIVRLSLHKGLCAESAAGILGLGVVHSALLGSFSRAEELGLIAQKIADRFNAHQLQGYLSMVYHAFIHHWNHRLKNSLPTLAKGADLALAAGDTEFWSYCCYWHGAHQLFVGGSLEELHRRLLGQWVATERRQQIKGRLLLQLLHTVRALGGESLKTEPIPDDIGTDELEKLWSNASDWNGLSYHRGFRALTHFYFEEFDKCAELLQSCQPFLPYLLGQSYYCQMFFYQTVSQIRLGQVTNENWPQIVGPWTQWSETSPDNYRHRLETIQAEYALKSGDKLRALELYLSAIQLASQQQISSDLAWLHQCVADLYTNQQDLVAALAHYSRAVELYQGWGAVAVAQRIKQRTLNLSEVGNQKVAFSALATIDAPRQDLDISALLQASQSLADMEDVPQVVERVLHLICQNAGATGGQIWLVEDDMQALPESIVRYVSRSLEVVILNGSLEESTFANDPYLKKQKPASVMCSPLLLHTRVLGVLYLENEFAANVFSLERLKAVQVMALQAAISTEIWRQFERLRIQQEELLREKERSYQEALRAESFKSHNRALASFLGIASHDLQTPLAVIRMWSQHLKPGAQEQSILRCRSILEKCVEQASGLIQSYLDAVSVELGKDLTLRRQELLLAKLVESELEFHQTSQGFEALSPEQIQLEEFYVRVDPLRFRQVVRNLIGNALQHSDAHTYNIRLWQEGPSAILEVENPASPPPEDTNHQLFHAFQPGDSSHGRGLGLWICRTLVEAHGGTIGSYHHPKRGMVFRVQIPSQEPS